MQKELKESEGKAENMMRSKATAVRQKKDADSNYAALQVFVCRLYMHDKMCLLYTCMEVRMYTCPSITMLSVRYVPCMHVCVCCV